MLNLRIKHARPIVVGVAIFFLDICAFFVVCVCVLFLVDCADKISFLIRICRVCVALCWTLGRVCIVCVCL